MAPLNHPGVTAVKFLIRWAACAVIVSLISVSAFAQTGDFKKPVAKLDLKSGDSVVFLGDSITHQCLYTQYVEDYYYTRYPKIRLRFHNAGVGGAQAWDALERFDRDVAAYKPKYVTILLGMNDGHYSPYNEKTFETYRKNMTEVIGRITSIKATPILITPTMFDSRAKRLRKSKWASSPATLRMYNSVLSFYGTWLREVAVDNGYGFVDMFSPLCNITLQQRKTDSKFQMIPDGVHPSAVGQVVMAVAILQDMNAKRPVSFIHLQKVKRKTKGSRWASGGKVSDVVWTDDGVRFTWLANSLPWVLPEDAQVGVKLTKLGHRMSREALSVNGLPLGWYQLSIDDQPVGTYPSRMITRFVELEENSKTPQYQQALAVAELNHQRNAGPVHALRDEWYQFQKYSRMRAQSKRAPKTAGLSKSLIALEKLQEGREARIKKLEQEAKVFEDKIFEINQPKPHRYELKRVERRRRR